MQRSSKDSGPVDNTAETAEGTSSFGTVDCASSEHPEDLQICSIDEGMDLKEGNSRTTADSPSTDARIQADLGLHGSSCNTRIRVQVEKFHNYQPWMTFLKQTMAALDVNRLSADTYEKFSDTGSYPERPPYVVTGDTRINRTERRQNALIIVNCILPHLVSKLKELEVIARTETEKYKHFGDLQMTGPTMSAKVRNLKPRLNSILIKACKLVMSQQELKQSDIDSFESTLSARADSLIEITDEIVCLASFHSTLYKDNEDAGKETKQILEKLFLLVRHPVFTDITIDLVKENARTVLGLKKEFIVSLEGRCLHAILVCWADLKQWIELVDTQDERKAIREKRNKCIELLAHIRECVERSKTNHIERSLMLTTLYRKASMVPISFESLQVLVDYKRTGTNLIRLHARTVIEFTDQLLLIIAENEQALDRYQDNASQDLLE